MFIRGQFTTKDAIRDVQGTHMYILEYQNNENFFVEIFSTVAMAYPLFHNGVHKFMPPTWQFSRLQTALKSLN